MKKITQLAIFMGITFSLFAQNEVSLIDFGNPDMTTTESNFNNVTNATNSETGITVALINSEGAATGVNLEVTDAFHLNNTGGTQTPDEALPFPMSASRDSFYGETSEFNGVTEPTGGFTLTGLDTSKYYSFSVFASRNGVSDIRETLYTIMGSTTKTGALDASNNTSNTAEIFNVQPNASGVITFQAEPSTNNNNSSGFYYLGAIAMTTSDTALAVTDFNFNNSLVVTNPVKELCEIRFNLQRNAFVNASIYDVNGRLVTTLINAEISAGDVSFNWDVTNSKTVASGLYVLKIKANGTVSTTKLIVK